jgi:signal transduction histidine kinase
VELTVLAEGAVPCQADASRIEQILFNLVSNAVQAGARKVVLAARDEDRPVLEVIDDGAGLPEWVRNHLFEPFVTTKPAGQGTGLGLAICQRLAREMGAELTLPESKPGHTVFRLAFGTVEGGHGMTPSLLIVEDDAALASMVTRLAQEAGFEAVLRHDGDSALRCLQETPPRRSADRPAPAWLGWHRAAQGRRSPSTRAVPCCSRPAMPPP